MDATPVPYNCPEAENDMHLFLVRGRFALHEIPPRFDGEAEQALERCLAHMTAGLTGEGFVIACQKCWDRFEELKKLYRNHRH